MPSTNWDDDQVAFILERIADNVPLARILRERPDLPSYRTIMGWRRDNFRRFAELYAIAREDQADTAADEITQISDEVAGCTDSAVVQAAKLRVEARKWVAGKLKPKQYGDRSTIEHAGELAVFNKTDAEIDARIAQLLAEAGTDDVAGGESEAQGPA